MWFGENPLTPLAKECIESWGELWAEFEIRRWDETNFDVSLNQYCRQAYDAKKWAFVSDYARIKVLSEYGGLYLDTDVRALKSLPENMLAATVLLGWEAVDRVSTAFIGAEPHAPLIDEMLASYSDSAFVREDGSLDETTNVKRLSSILEGHGFLPDGTRQSIKGIEIYPSEYFSPRDWLTGKTNITENTCSVHLFDESWVGGKTKLKNSLMHLAGPTGVSFAKSVMSRLGGKEK
jgi:hypothetical protein